MDPNIWGPHAWFLIESAVIHMPEDADVKNYVDFLIQLQHILPCKGCRENYKQHLIEKPPPVTNKEDLVNWVIELHNDVREFQNKPVRSKVDVLKYYRNSPNDIWVTVIAIFVLLLLVFWRRMPWLT
jgi:hypothetical protein